jgi:hypothetical protein
MQLKNELNVSVIYLKLRKQIQRMYVNFLILELSNLNVNFQEQKAKRAERFKPITSV